MSAHIPAVVMALAVKVSGNPIAWTIYPDRVVIVMEDGRKLAFEKESETSVVGSNAPSTPLPPKPQAAEIKTKSNRKEK